MITPSLFIVSTPLHLLVSIAIVDTLKIEQAHLLFIDQVVGRANPYYETIKNWTQSPFSSVDILYRPDRNVWRKLTVRKKTFQAIKQLVERIRPQHIYTGNDRRIEFQSAMHQSTQMRLYPTGYYMDEGTFTYVGRKASNSFADRYIDNIFKKLAYGLWWQHPVTVGASNWINIIYVSYPALVHPLLKTKNTVHLNLQFWQSELLISFCHQLVSYIGYPDKLAQLDVVITLPHESILQANIDYKNKITAIVEQYLQQGYQVGIKYHPRDAQDDALQLASNKAVSLLSKALPFEALLPMIKANAMIIGDFSTTLITSRLLRPDLTVQAIDHGDQEKAQQFAELYKKLGITVVSS